MLFSSPPRQVLMRLLEHTTTTLLLEGLHDPGNQRAWQEFQERYVPIMLAFARRLGLSESDAADVTQDGLVRFLQEYRAGQYDRQRGRLRSWLISIVRFRVADRWRLAAKDRIVAGDTAIGQLPVDSELEALWDAEQRREILRRAFQSLRSESRLAEKTILAFERLVIDERPVADVAAELQMTANDVYVAKSRVYERLSAVVLELETIYRDA